MKKKDKYSLTAKQRKDARQTIKPYLQTQPELTVEDKEVVVRAKLSKRVKVTLYTLLSVLVVVLLVFIPMLISFFVNPYQGAFSKKYDTDNPIAEMRLSNGMMIKYEIFEDTCPIAASNFIFLARAKYFDNTIIFDTQKDWVRFGGYVSPTLYRASDKEYLEKFDGIVSEEHSKNKLGYRLYADSSADAKRTTDEGMLCFLYDDTATEFQISSRPNAQINLQSQSGTSTTYEPTALGSVLDDQSLLNIKEIAALERTDNYLDSSKPWKGPKSVIKIESVKIFNLKRDKWKNFDFEEYMKTARNGASAIQYWNR